MPAPHTILNNRWIARFGPRIREPNLWHLNRRSVSAGIAMGVLAAFIPLPVQIFVAISLCFVVRGNLALAVAATWISNPFTYLPIFFFCYELGTAIVGVPLDHEGVPIKIGVALVLEDFEAFLALLNSLRFKAVAPLLLGCLLVGTLASGASYVLIRILWRLHIKKAWKHRSEQRLTKSQQASS